MHELPTSNCFQTRLTSTVINAIYVCNMSDVISTFKMTEIPIQGDFFSVSPPGH